MGQLTTLNWSDTHKYEGRIIGNYFLYEAMSTEQEAFRLSTAMLFIATSGKTMRGFFIANGGLKDPYRIFVGFTVMHKR
ncbi:MAG: hypothetical protein MN733_09350 [Nitrososphaera sp.]|nr:hypothetical protein [Nitrososphaera sp.]